MGCKKPLKDDSRRKQSEINRIQRKIGQNNIPLFKALYETFDRYGFHPDKIKYIIQSFQELNNNAILNRECLQYSLHNPHAKKQKYPPNLQNQIKYYDKRVLNKIGKKELYLYLADSVFDYPDEFLSFIKWYVVMYPNNSLDVKQFIEDLSNEIAKIKERKIYSIQELEKHSNPESDASPSRDLRTYSNSESRFEGSNPNLETNPTPTSEANPTPKFETDSGTDSILDFDEFSNPESYAFLLIDQSTDSYPESRF